MVIKNLLLELLDQTNDSSRPRLELKRGIRPNVDWSLEEVPQLGLMLC